MKLDKVVSLRKEITNHVRLSEGSFKTIKKYVTASKNANESLNVVCVDLIVDAEIGLGVANMVFAQFKQAIRRRKALDLKGFIWKLELSDDKFYYHCIFFLKAEESVDTSELAKNILQIWNEKNWKL